MSDDVVDAEIVDDDLPVLVYEQGDDAARTTGTSSSSP